MKCYRIIDSNDLKCPLNKPVNTGTRSCTCHSILIHFCCPLVVNELGFAFGNGKEHLIIPAHVLAQSLGEKHPEVMMPQAYIGQLERSACLMYIRATHCECIDDDQRELFQKHRSPSLEYLHINADHLYRYMLLGSIHGPTYLRWSSVERSTTSYSLWMVMEEVSCLKVIGSHI